jgi:hypothetical protein
MKRISKVSTPRQTAARRAWKRRRAAALALEQSTLALVLAELRKKPKHRPTTVMMGGEMSGVLIGNLKLCGDATLTGTVVGDLILTGNSSMSGNATTTGNVLLLDTASLNRNVDRPK